MATKKTVEPVTLDHIPIKKDRTTLGVLLASIKKYRLEVDVAERELKWLIPQALVLMEGHDALKIEFQDYYLSRYASSNVTYPQKKLALVMINHKIDTETIGKI